jgi:hypothetical protein
MQHAYDKSLGTEGICTDMTENTVTNHSSHKNSYIGLCQLRTQRVNSEDLVGADILLQTAPLYSAAQCNKYLNPQC